MAEYINPFRDIVFKYIFGRNETKNLLKSFINAVLADVDMETVTEIEILNPFNLKEFQNDKFSFLDIKAEAASGEIYNIEVQLSGFEEYKFRTLYYWAKLYTGQLGESENYAELKPVICINILDFNLIKELDSFHTCFLPYEYQNRDILLTGHFQVHFLEILKFKDNILGINQDLKFWFKYLTLEGQNQEEKMKGILDEKEEFKKAHEEYKKFTADKKMRDLYEARLKFKRDNEAILREAKIKAREEGLKEGLKEGIEKGIKESKIATAKNMKKEGFEASIICKITGLNQEQIKEL